jgi:hypothetical protein
MVHPIVAINMKKKQLLSIMAEEFVREAEYIHQILPDVRVKLEPMIQRLKGQRPLTRIAAVDGSNNTENLALINQSLCVYSSAGILGNLHQVLKTQLCYNIETIPKEEYHHLYPVIQRDRLELQMIFDLANHEYKPEVVLADGSILASQLWLMKIQAHQLDIERIGIVKEVFKRYIDISNPQSLYNKVLSEISRKKIVYIPKESTSRTFLRRFLPSLIPEDLYTNIHDIQIMHQTLNTGEFIGPIPFKKLIIGNAPLRSGDLAANIDITFFKPLGAGARAIKVQTHRNHRNQLPHILATISQIYNTQAQEPYHLIVAHNKAKELIPSLGDVREQLFRQAIFKSESEIQKQILRETFDLGRRL